MILEKIGESATYEQLAEEFIELATTTLKMARILRSENPTPVTKYEALKALREETTDVDICLKELALEPVQSVKDSKLHRFLERWEARNK